MQDGNVKQQVVERIKKATNILVTVNSNPTADQLSAALSLTFMLNKMDKHATAVFSGTIPPAITFLEPAKTFENNVDSLRDFIIALDKDKADRLRYKVENDVVRVFITPYRTSISEKDLQFSQGDFNVELIIALGVEKREELDSAIVAHGRILHDATTITINTAHQNGNLGSIDWDDSAASSLCEMLMSLSEALQPGLLDEQIATALLTGIVAATERFSNARTTPRVMTMSAQLMAAGANQQLIATKLEEHSVLPPASAHGIDGSTYLQEGASSRVQAPGQSWADSNQAASAAQQPLPPAQSPDGEMHVQHTPAGGDTAHESQKSDAADDESRYDVERALTEKLSLQMPAQPHSRVPDLSKELEKEQQQANNTQAPTQQPKAEELSLPSVETGADQNPFAQSAAKDVPKLNNLIHGTKPAWMGPQTEPPSMGGALSATTQQALDDARREREERNKYPVLSHESSELEPEEHPAQPEAQATSQFDLQFEETPLPSLAKAQQPAAPAAEPEQAHNEATSHAPTLAELEEQVHAAAKAAPSPPPPAATEPSPEDQAREAVHAALGSTDFDPANNPLQSVGAQPFPPIVHDAPAGAPSDQPPLPPLPDFNTLPPLPVEPAQNNSPFIDSDTTPPGQAPTAVPAPQPQQAASELNPGQFRIPGQ